MKRSPTRAILTAIRAGIPHDVHEYEHNASAHSYGLEAAAALGVPVERVFKTLIAVVEGGYVVAIVPVARQLNLRALAEATGGKRAEMAGPADAERVTGYVQGGISPLGQRKSLPTFLDRSALGHATIYVSAGRRGLNISLDPHDLMHLTRAICVPLVQE